MPLTNDQFARLASASPLLAGVAAVDLEYLRERGAVQSFEPGAVLLAQGSFADGLHIILAGAVSVRLRGVDGSERRIGTLGVGECAGEMSLLGGEACSATVVAPEGCETWFLSRDDFARAVEDCPGLWRNLTSILSERLRQTNRRLSDRSRARLSTLTLLVDSPAPARALALIIGATVARQTLRRTLLLDITRDGLGLVQPGETADRPDEGLSLVRLEERLHAATLGDGLVSKVERLSEAFDELILVRSDGTAPPGAFAQDACEAAVIVTSVARISEAAKADYPEAQVAILTSAAVTSDNGVGGLWEPAILRELRHASDTLGPAIGARVRLIPADDSLLSEVASHRVAAVPVRPLTPFAQAVARLGRRLAGVEVGVALGAGMAKGFAHLGVLDVLAREGVPVDYIGGASIGSIVGSVYAGGMSLDELRALMTGADRRFARPTLPLRSISGNGGLKKILTGCHERAPTATFPELFLPFAAVATDVASGHEVVFREGIVWEAVLASISMPGIFPPVRRGSRVLVDGGLVNPVPGQTVRDMGAGIVINVDLATWARDRGFRPRAHPRVPNIIENLWRSMEIMLGEITARSAASADVTIRPEVGHSHIRDFSRRGPEFIRAGEEAARAALPPIKRLLPGIGASKP